MFTRCTGTSCYGLRFQGRLLRCPKCQSTLVTFHPAPTVAASQKAAA